MRENVTERDDAFDLVNVRAADDGEHAFDATVTQNGQPTEQSGSKFVQRVGWGKIHGQKIGRWTQNCLHPHLPCSRVRLIMRQMDTILFREFVIDWFGLKAR